MMTKTEAIQAIQDHINACRPCTLRGVINWCKAQGLPVVLVPQALSTVEPYIDYEHDDDSGDTVLS